MDAIKALQALNDGDMFGLVAALDTDQSLVLVKPDDGERIVSARIGRTIVACCEEDSTRHQQLQLHVMSTVSDAEGAFNDRVAQIQAMRAAMVAAGGPPVPLWVDGLLAPIPEATTEMIIAGLTAAVDRARALVSGGSETIPDDISGIQA